MDLLLSILLLIVGFALMIKGADWLVEGASVLAKLIGMSDLMIGLTIVAFGTSMPELLVNIIASMQGNTDIAIGNVVGSNIANTMLAIGAASLFGALSVKSSTVWKEIPFSLLASVVLLVIVNDAFINNSDVSILTRSEGIILLLFFIIFLYYTFGLRQKKDDDGQSKQNTMQPITGVGLIFLGCIMLPLGGKFSVDAAINIATHIGISEALIGLSIVALGTSLPEVVTACIAVRKKRADIAIGNIVGSNIFNIFWILGISAVIHPLTFNPMLNVDLMIVVITSVLLFILVQRGPIYRRIFLFWKQKQPEYALLKHEGILLLIGYVMYLVYIGWRG